MSDDSEILAKMVEVILQGDCHSEIFEIPGSKFTEKLERLTKAVKIAEYMTFHQVNFEEAKEEVNRLMADL